MRANMAQVKVYYDQIGNTLTVWFGNPQDEYVAEETGDEVILMKDKAGNVLRFTDAVDNVNKELNFTPKISSSCFFTAEIF